MKKLRIENLMLECPFCGLRAKAFLPGGLNSPVLKKYNVISSGPRPNKICPSCGSKDRERLLYFYLKSKTNILIGKQTIKILHIAPEKNSQNILIANPNIDYIAANS